MLHYFSILMTVVKIQNKDRLDKLVARLTMRLGRKPTQQEIVDTSIRMADERFEELLVELTSVPVIDDKKLRDIQAIAEDLADVPWKTGKTENLCSDDADIYGT